MLIFKRYEGRPGRDAIQIGDGIRVVVLRVERNGVVTLGIDAPRDLLVLRGEVAEREAVERDAQEARILELHPGAEKILPLRRMPERNGSAADRYGDETEGRP